MMIFKTTTGTAREGEEPCAIAVDDRPPLRCPRGGVQHDHQNYYGETNAYKGSTGLDFATSSRV